MCWNLIYNRIVNALFLCKCAEENDHIMKSIYLFVVYTTNVSAIKFNPWLHGYKILFLKFFLFLAFIALQLVIA